jgi:hypothetical protein
MPILPPARQESKKDRAETWRGEPEKGFAWRLNVRAGAGLRSPEPGGWA